MTAQSLPLAAYERFHTQDLDEARAHIGEAFAPYCLRLTNRAARLNARMNAVTFDRTGLFSIDYGTEASITPGAWGSCFLVAVSLAGVVEVSLSREQIVSTPEIASVLSPTEDLSMRFAAGSPQLIARVDRSAMETHLGQMLGRHPHRPIVFSLGMDLAQPMSQSWLSIVDLLRREAESGGDILTRPLALKQLESLLMTQLLLAQPNNYTSALLGEQPRIAPPAVKRAMELIEGHAAEPLTVEDIAEAVGIGVRALQEGFRRHLETTPLAYLRDVRLERVRAELTIGAPGATTVTDIAFRWGFVHLGRFSLAYRQRFGETPSETLRG